MVAIGFADGAILIRPRIPDVGVEVVDVVALLLPDPKDLIDRGFKRGAADGEDWEFLLEVISIDDAEFLDCVRRSAISPMWTDVVFLIGDAVLHDLFHVFNENLVCSTHKCLRLICSIL